MSYNAVVEWYHNYEFLWGNWRLSNDKEFFTVVSRCHELEFFDSQKP